jgi:hypothetical protein
MNVKTYAAKYVLHVNRSVRRSARIQTAPNCVVRFAIGAPNRVKASVNIVSVLSCAMRYAVESPVMSLVKNS